MQKSKRFTERYGINEENLAIRRAFIRLDEAERELLVELIPWAEQSAANIAREFYDWQFSFASTLSFFETFATGREMSMAELREHLEHSQTEYYLNLFTGAGSSWGVDYFEHRLKVGWVHDQINLPFKWYVGGYIEYQILTRKYLRQSFDRDKADAAEQAIFKVFNYDMQAIGDSFLMNSLETLGLSLEGVEAEHARDKTEYIEELKKNVATLLEQAQAIAAKKLNDDVLGAAIPGQLGEAFALIVEQFKSFVEQVTQHSHTLASASEELHTVSQQMSASAQQSTDQASAVSAAAEQVSSNAHTVAAAVEETSASVKEIAANAAKVATNAVDLASESSAGMESLGKGAEQIGKMIKGINTIAQQTRLLALNATIEAARAGEAGKGFAVVADEVKELAKESNKFADDISEIAGAIQGDTGKSVESIGKVTEIINQIQDLQSGIASAVEEQTATVGEMGRNVSQAAQASGDIAKNISSVAELLKQTSGGVNDTSEAASELARLAAALQALVDEFK